MTAGARAAWGLVAALAIPMADAPRAAAHTPAWHDPHSAQQPAPPAELPVWEREFAAGHLEQGLAALRAACEAGDPVLCRLLLERLMQAQRFEAALELASNLGPEGHGKIGPCLYYLGRYKQALVSLDPEQPLQTLMRVDCLERLGRAEQAWPALEQAARVLGPDHPELLATRGRLLAAEGEDEQAVAAFQKALASDPLQMAARFGLGRALLRLGRTNQARAVLAEHERLLPLVDQRDAARRAVQLAPRHAPNLALLGDAERALGRLKEAEQDYLQAETLARESDRLPVLLRHARLLNEDLHDVDGAVALLQAQSEYHDDARLPVRVGDMLAAAGRHAEAGRAYQRALALRPGDPQILARLQRLSSGDDDPR